MSALTPEEIRALLTLAIETDDRFEDVSRLLAQRYNALLRILEGKGILTREEITRELAQLEAAAAVDALFDVDDGGITARRAARAALRLILSEQ